MTTAQDMVNETRLHLLGGFRETATKLTADIAVGATALSFLYEVGAIKAGSVLSIGLERMYVWATSTPTTATVERGWDGTTAVAHTTSEIVRVNSRYDDYTILRALNHEIDDLSSPANGMFKIGTLDLTFDASTYGYDLTAVSAMIGPPLRVLTEGSGTGDWTPLKPSQYEYLSSADTGDFASGRAILLTSGYGTPGQSLRLVYRAPFTQFATLADNATATGLPSTAYDIPPLGAAATLGASRPMKRSDIDSQGSSRRAEEVTTQDTLISSRGLLAQRDRRIQSEAARLAAEYPQVI